MVLEKYSFCGGRVKKKQTVLEKLKAFFEKMRD